MPVVMVMFNGFLDVDQRQHMVDRALGIGASEVLDPFTAEDLEGRYVGWTPFVDETEVIHRMLYGVDGVDYIDSPNAEDAARILGVLALKATAVPCPR